MQVDSEQMIPKTAHRGWIVVHEASAGIWGLGPRGRNTLEQNGTAEAHCGRNTLEQNGTAEAHCGRNTLEQNGTVWGAWPFRSQALSWDLSAHGLRLVDWIA